MSPIASKKENPAPVIGEDSKFIQLKESRRDRRARERKEKSNKH